jgi:hypothetical protein
LTRYRPPLLIQEIGYELVQVPVFREKPVRSVIGPELESAFLYDMCLRKPADYTRFLDDHEIKSDIDFNTGFNLSIPTAGGAPVGVVATATIYERDRRSFLGAGPRIGIGGSVPIMGPLVFDYTADAAVLFGNTKWSTGQVVGVGVNVPGAFAFSLTGLGLNQATWSSNITVYNFDVEGGLGWWLTPNWKISATYRLDAFIDPLRTAPDDGANAGVGLLGGGTNIGPGRSLDRFYHGPKLAVEGRF